MERWRKLFELRAQGLRLMVYQAAWKRDRGEDVRYDAYMVRMRGDRLSFECADHCMQIHGAVGLTHDLPIEKFWRDQRSMIITEGPEEIMKMVLARRVFELYGQGNTEQVSHCAVVGLDANESVARIDSSDKIA